MELYQIDRQLRDLPQFYKMYSMYEMEECIENKERYGNVISRLEKMADKIERNQAIAYLEYDIAKDKYPLMPYNKKESIVKISDYNKIAKLFGLKEYTLNDDEYFIVANYSEYVG